MAAFSALLLDVYDRVGLSQAPASGDVRRLKRYVNRWYRKVLTAPGMGRLRLSTISVASVASTPTYGVPLETIAFITEATNDQRLFEKSLGWYREYVPDPTAFTGTPDTWVPLGWTRVAKQPSDASELFAKSTEAADTGTIYVEGLITGGYRRTASVSLTGVTAVSLSAAITTFIQVEDVYLSAAQTGTVTLHEDSGTGTELARITIGATYPRYLRFALVPTPSGVITYSVEGTAPLLDLTNDTDEPSFNPDFHDILVDGAVYDDWLHRGKEKDARQLRAEIEQRIRRLRATLWTYDEGDERRERSFEETVSLPIS